MSNPFDVVRDFEAALCEECAATLVGKKPEARFCSHRCAAIARERARSEPAEQRFWKYVEKTDSCWLWTGAKIGNGYGHITVKRQSIKTHRFSWELHYGAIPAGMFVCHRCDVKACVRPDHLFLGTNQDNQLDAVAKGRHVCWNRGLRGIISI